MAIIPFRNPSHLDSVGWLIKECYSPSYISSKLSDDQSYYADLCAEELLHFPRDWVGRNNYTETFRGSSTWIETDAYDFMAYYWDEIPNPGTHEEETTCAAIQTFFSGGAPLGTKPAGDDCGQSTGKHCSVFCGPLATTIPLCSLNTNTIEDWEKSEYQYCGTYTDCNQGRINGDLTTSCFFFGETISATRAACQLYEAYEYVPQWRGGMDR